MDIKQKLLEILDTIIDWATKTGVKLVIGALVLLISFKIINKISRRIERASDKGKFDKTLAKTFAYIFKLALKCIIAICIVGYVGIDTSGLAALVTSLGVCVGLALNGALSNLAGGVIIIMTRPFRVDDFIEAQGYSGTVEDIHITCTRLLTPDNKVVYIPNGALSSGGIINYSEKDERRVDLSFTISYDADFEKAQAIIRELCDSHELILKDPEPTIRMSAHGDSSIVVLTRVWVKKDDYWTVNYDLHEAVKREFDKAGIEIPYNQLDVHLKQDKAG